MKPYFFIIFENEIWILFIYLFLKYFLELNIGKHFREFFSYVNILKVIKVENIRLFKYINK